MNFKHIIFLLSIVALIACSEKDGMEDKQQPTPSIIDDADNLVPVQFSVSGKLNIDFTRALTSIITFNAGETVKVFVKPNGAANYTGYDYITASSGQNNVPLTAPATPPYYPPGPSTTVEAYAYYPSTASTTFTVQDDQTSDTNYKASDLMYAVNRTVTKGASYGNDHLLMNHQMAQLAITATAQAGSGLTIARVEVDALKSVTFAPNTASIVTATGATGTITALNAAGTGYIVIPPQIINGVVIRVITGSGTDAEIATYAFTGTTGNFESGASYGINLTVSPDQLGLTSSINNWNGLGSVNVTPSGNLSVSAIAAQEYTGSAITPSFTVYRDGAIFDSDNYNVQWVNNIQAGTAYVLITGKDLSGNGGPNYSTCVGLANFIITPANGKIDYAVKSLTKTYLNDPFTNHLSNYDTREGHEGQAADGEVTYVSSNPLVATVNENTGEVTLVKSGIVTITATATNGANYVYSTTENNHISSYTLTVNKAAGNVSFEHSLRDKTWSPTEANTYKQTATITGDATATYSIGSTNTCNASINSASGEVTFTRSGDVQVIATVTDTERYAYATNTASYTLHVYKAAGSISFANSTPRKTYSKTSANNTYTQTVTQTGDASVTYSIGSTNTCGATINSSTGAVTFTDVGSVQVRASVSDTYRYTYATSTVTYTLTVNSSMATVSANDVGNILATDGVIYTSVAAAEEAGATASGIIAYVSSSGTVDSSNSSYRCLVISLADASNVTVQWRSGSSGVNPNTGTCVTQNGDLPTVLGYLNGIACTNTLYNSNGTGVTNTCIGHNHPPARLSREYSTARPVNTSEWFLASIGQWNLILKGLAKRAGFASTPNLIEGTNATYIPSNGINSIIAEGADGLSDAFYAASTENSTYYIWDPALHQGMASRNTKGGNYLVRPVFAF